RALVLDSVYDDPKEMVKIEVASTGLSVFPFMVRSAQLSFEWLNYQFKQEPPLSKRIGALKGVSKLFIEASDEPELAESTRELFVRAREPREQLIIPYGIFVGMANEKNPTKENRVVTYFQIHLPATSGAAR